MPRGTVLVQSTGPAATLQGEDMSAGLDELMTMTEAKTEFSGRIRRLRSGELERVVVITRSSPVAVILAVSEYERLQVLEGKREEIDDILMALKAKAVDDGTRLSLSELEARIGSI
jgi:prevent-host-death family protein